MKKLSVVFLDQASLDQGDLDMQRLHDAAAKLTLYPVTTADQVAERVVGHQVIITNKVVIDEQAMQACPELQLILVSATGTNNVDLQAAQRRGITVCNCQAYGTPSVAQHALMLMLVLVTRFESYRQAVRDGAWQRSSQFCLLDYPIGELSGRTLGILGYGELGQEVGRLASAFGMRILVGALPGREHPDRPNLAELLPQVDVLSLHCPLTEHTRHLIGAEQLALMKPGSLLINAGRGRAVRRARLHDLRETQLEQHDQPLRGAAGRLAGRSAGSAPLHDPRRPVSAQHGAGDRRDAGRCRPRPLHPGAVPRPRPQPRPQPVERRRTGPGALSVRCALPARNFRTTTNTLFTLLIFNTLQLWDSLFGSSA